MSRSREELEQQLISAIQRSLSLRSYSVEVGFNQMIVFTAKDNADPLELDRIREFIQMGQGHGYIAQNNRVYSMALRHQKAAEGFWLDDDHNPDCINECNLA